MHAEVGGSSSPGRDRGGRRKAISGVTEEAKDIPRRQEIWGVGRNRKSEGRSMCESAGGHANSGVHTEFPAGLMDGAWNRAR